MPETTQAVRAALRAKADPKRAETFRRFFKTAEGEYAAKDEFIGVSVPDQRQIARQFRGLPIKQAVQLLHSPVHEERLTALFLLVDTYERSKNEPKTQEQVVQAFLGNLDWIDNWDLVDSSSPKIWGHWLLTRDRALLYEQIESPNLWHRRIAMLATQTLIAHGESKDALALAERLLDDPEDLLHKAGGWMLREVGEKVGLAPLRGFLKVHARRMPRTMLRSSIEKLGPEERKKWLSNH